MNDIEHGAGDSGRKQEAESAKLLALLKKGARVRVGRDWGDTVSGTIKSDTEFGDALDVETKDGKTDLLPLQGTIVTASELSFEDWNKIRQNDRKRGVPSSRFIKLGYVTQEDQKAPVGHIWVEVRGK